MRLEVTDGISVTVAVMKRGTTMRKGLDDNGAGSSTVDALLRLTVLRKDQTNRHSDPVEQYLRELTGQQFRGLTSKCCLTYSHQLLRAAAILPPRSFFPGHMQLAP